MNRKVLYGYQIMDGKLVPQPQEAAVVSRVFGLYLEGNLQREISDTLNAEGILYSPERPVWTKFRISFILRNERYMGADDYPVLIGSETFQAVQTGQEITEEFLDIASLVQQGQECGGVDPLALRQRLTALTAEQAVLMEQALALPEDTENKELNARLREIAEERESILHQLGTLQQADERQAGQAARMNSLREFVERRETKFAAYDDAITRKFVEQVTVLDAETIRVKFRYPGLEVDKKLN